MEEKKILQAILEKVYIEVQDMKANMATKQDLARVNAEIEDTKANMATKQDLARLEFKMDENHRALYDGYSQCIEGINDLRNKVDKLTDRVENQEIKLQVLRSVK